MGLHTRPATLIVQMLQEAKSDVQFTYKRETINAKSILGLLTLAAGRNAYVTITVEGVDAKQIMENLLQVFENNFGER